MPINTTHPLYNEYQPAMKRTSDAYEGKVYDYIPKLTGQTNEQYDAYRHRSSFYNVIERTLTALVGALTRRSHSIEYVVGDDPVFYGDIGEDEFITQCYADIFKTGRVGLLVDYDDVAETPYIISYNGMNIVNWGDSFYVLAETYFAPNPKDPYEQLLLTRYRELFMDPAGLYTVRIWEQKKTPTGGYGSSTKPQYEVVETITPTIRGMRLNYIPFTVVNANGVGVDKMGKPPLGTMADINIDHFKVSVDIGHGAHFIALPTPYITGDLQNDAQVVRLGTDQFIHLTAGSSTGFLEFTGAGMNFLTELAKTKEEQMYSLGSRMLQYKRGVESSDALQIRLGAEGASLVTIATALEEGLQMALYWYNLWLGMDVEPEVELNKDVSPTVMDPKQVMSLLQLFQTGVISLDTLLQRLYEGEIVDDVSEERELLTGQEEAGEEAEAAVEGPDSEDEPEENARMAEDGAVRNRSR